MQTRYVNPDSTAGGDGTTDALTGANRAYVSWSVWEAARQGVLTEIEECICETGGTADSTNVAFDGWTTTAAFYIDIKTSAGHRHAGIYDTAKYRHTGTNTISEEYTRFTGIQFVTPAVAYQPSLSYPATGVHYVASCIFKGPGSDPGGGSYGAIFGEGADRHLTNCLFYDYIGGSNGRAFYGGSAGSTCYNCTFVDCTAGIDWQWAGGGICKNNLFQNVASPLTGTFAAGTDYNACTTSTLAGANANYTQTGGPGGHDRVSQTFTLVNEASDDFHLAVSDAGARDFGEDLSGTFTDDIDGQTRSGTWDIGADFSPDPPPPTIFTGMVPTLRM